jgi:Tol biopolymer transport system component
MTYASPSNNVQTDNGQPNDFLSTLVTLLPSLILVILTVAVVLGLALTRRGEVVPQGSLLQPAKIVFVSDRSGDFEVYAMDRNGENIVNLTNSLDNEGFPLPNLDQLAFASDRSGTGLTLFVVNLDGTGLAEIETPPNTVNLPTAWSPDSRYLIFESNQAGSSEQFLVDMDTQETISFNREFQARFDSWSADGQRLLISVPTETGIEISISDLSGMIKQPLTDGTYPAGLPVLSPDGQTVAFVATPPGSGPVDIYTVGVAGGEPVNLTQSDSNDLFPRWSPDGSKIAFISDRDENAEIYVMDSDGGNLINLSNSLAQESPQGDFSWSPDGSQILFHTDRDGDVEVYIMDATGENQTNLSNSPGNDFSAIWVQ